jgi:hypothetical protein
VHDHPVSISKRATRLRKWFGDPIPQPLDLIERDYRGSLLRALQRGDVQAIDRDGERLRPEKWAHGMLGRYVLISRHEVLKLWRPMKDDEIDADRRAEPKMAAAPVDETKQPETNDERTKIAKEVVEEVAKRHIAETNFTPSVKNHATEVMDLLVRRYRRNHALRDEIERIAEVHYADYRMHPGETKVRALKRRGLSQHP